jgi:flagellin-like protein
MFKELFADDNERGVSPVIGVILMVAITVILAAVIGAFVLGLGDQVSETAPNAQISFDFDGNKSVTLTHDGGDPIANDSVTFNINGNATDDSVGWVSGGTEQIKAGDSVTLAKSDNSSYTNIVASDFRPGNTVRVIWTGDSGSSNTIAQRDFPN